MLLFTWYPDWESYFANSGVKKRTVIRSIASLLLNYGRKVKLLWKWKKSVITTFMTYALRFNYFLLLLLLILQISCFTASVFFRLLITSRTANRFRHLVGLLLWGIDQSQFLWPQYRQQDNKERGAQPSIHLANRSNHPPIHTLDCYYKIDKRSIVSETARWMDSLFWVLK